MMAGCGVVGLLLFFHATLHVVSADPFDQCRQTPKFSTKTGYKLLTEVTAPVQKPAGYTPVQINMVFRHGERFPGNDDVKEMKELAKKINNMNSTSSEVNLTLPWVIKFQGIEDMMLSKEGESVLYGLGKRIRSRFPEVFMKNYTTYNYKLLSTCKTRTTGSVDSIAMGIFEGHGHLGNDKLQPIHLEVYPCDEDTILKGLDNCNKYKTAVDDNKKALIEVKRFEKGSEVKTLIDSIKRKLGDVNMTLSFDEIKTMYDYCSWSIIMFGGNLQSGVCSLFSQEELSVVEYHEDMEDYYKRSTGYNISYQPSCPLLRDIYQGLQSKAGSGEEKYGKYSAVLRAGHSDTILPFLALFGVYTNDLKMTSKNYQANKNRIFRAGCLAPFSANAYFVLYKNNGTRYKIQFYVNERLTKIPGCSSKVNCDFTEFENHYKNIVENCDYKKICGSNSNQLSTSAPTRNPFQLLTLIIGFASAFILVI